jgi:hypothetical protein
MPEGKVGTGVGVAVGVGVEVGEPEAAVGVAGRVTPEAVVPVGAGTGVDRESDDASLAQLSAPILRAVTRNVLQRRPIDLTVRADARRAMRDSPLVQWPRDQHRGRTGYPRGAAHGEGEPPA